MAKLIDGGYLTWVYGAKVFTRMGWQPKKYKGDFLVLDAPPLIRTIEYPGYKQARAERRKSDPKAMARHRMVQEFRSIITDDPRLRICQVPWMEADDLIAFIAWLRPGLSLISADKDMLQLSPYLQEQILIDGAQVDISRFKRGLPVCLQDLPLEAGNMPLYQALMGDHSDSIPRLVARGQLTTVLKVFDSGRPWELARRYYKDDLEENLGQVLMPYYRYFTDNYHLLSYWLEEGLWCPEYLLGLISPVLRDILEELVKEITDAREVQLPAGSVGGREEEAPQAVEEDGGGW